MVMMFLSEKARRHLLAKGTVYTYRIKKRKAGMDWANVGYGKPKFADIEIAQEYPILKAEDLMTFVGGSGFDTMFEWIEEIERLNRIKGDIIWNGFVNRVNLVTRYDQDQEPSII
jgi:hypothetical protein